MSFTTRPELKGTFGMVSSTHWLGSAAGMAVLEAGGNAFDAAVATGFVLQVVEPHLNGLGGEVPILLWDAGSRHAAVICGQGTAPASASLEAMRDLGLDQVPGDGLLAACVPGAFGGWLRLLRDHGTASLAEVLEPAIRHAEHGYPVVPRITATIQAVESVFRQNWPTSAAVYLEGGLPQPGTLFRNPTLAQTYKRLLAAGQAAGRDREAQIEAAQAAFYSGFVAEAIDRHCRLEFGDSSGGPHGGYLRADDLAAWRVGVEEPVLGTFGRWAVAKCGPWSQGPVFLQQLKLAEQTALAETDFLSLLHIHAVTEGAKLAFADREAWYADPAFADVPLQALLSPAYAAERRELIGDEASLELRPGSPGGRVPLLPRAVEIHRSGRGGRLGEPSRDTVHVAAADRWGNLVACTPSGGWLQSSPVVAELGFPLGTRAQMLNLDPEHPNRLEGGKRPRTTLSPSLALFDGEPRLAFGTPGGDQQDQWSFEFFLAHAIFGQDLQQAVDAPMFHTSHFPSSFAPHDAHPGRLHLESRVDAGVIAQLRQRGHEVAVEDAWALGRLCAVARDPRSGVLSAAASPRGGTAYAAGR